MRFSSAILLKQVYYLRQLKLIFTVGVLYFIAVFALQMSASVCSFAAPKSQVALIKAIQANQLSKVNSILMADPTGYDFDIENEELERNDTLLILAVRTRTIALIKRLLEAGADVNRGRSDEMTPLHIAAYIGDEPTARLLIDSGADVDSSTSDGITPLISAVLRGHENVVELLLERNAQANKAMLNGATALMIAAQKRQASIVIQLVHFTHVQRAIELVTHVDRGYAVENLLSILREHCLSDPAVKILYETTWANLQPWVVKRRNSAFELNLPRQKGDLHLPEIPVREVPFGPYYPGSGDDRQVGGRIDGLPREPESP